MRTSSFITVDGNEAAASIAHRLSEVIVIYPITPSSTMGELSEEWSSAGRTNIYGQVPDVVQMQSEAGAIGAVHGSLQAGALSTTFTASQGLLLMIPNLYKIAGELTPIAIHVAARAIATSSLSIFGDHSDVMACRQTGVAMLASSSVQEAHDLAAIAHMATLESRVPFIHFFDGFRTSHELNQIVMLSDDDLRSLIDESHVRAYRDRALTPDHPVIRGTAQNPDTFFQQREAVNSFYAACPATVKSAMHRFSKLTGRLYELFEYSGHPQAERVIVIIGSGTHAAQAACDKLMSEGERVGVLTVRLYRPFDIDGFANALPASVKRIAVLDRTKEPGAIGEPLYLDVVAAIDRYASVNPNFHRPTIVGGRYGLSSKEFTPAMASAVFNHLGSAWPYHGFTVGILDDITRASLVIDDEFIAEPEEVVSAMFYGLGADGTVGANKNSIKILGEESGFFAQGYFVYDSKKSGAMTVSHLRFGPRPINAPWLIRSADFVACHQFEFLERTDVLQRARDGAVFLINAPCAASKVWNRLPAPTRAAIIRKGLRVYAIDARKVAKEADLGQRINTIMQTCFFAISGVLPRDQAIAAIKKSIEKSYRRKGADVVEKNWAAVDQTLANLHQIPVPAEAIDAAELAMPVPSHAPDFVQRVTAMLIAGKGDLLPVSAFPPDGTYPSDTARWEKRSIAREIPIWQSDSCIQCGKCAFVCPHAAIRAKAFEPSVLDGAPESFRSMEYKAKDLRGLNYTIQVAPDDCTGCTLCTGVCPTSAISMEPKARHEVAERGNFDFFLRIPDLPRHKVVRIDVKGSQLFRPLFEFSGACMGCGQTPYVKLLTQLFGDRLLIANATGCSSIYGGNLPTTPYCANSDGRGPAWCNSLFEDNAEFGLGMRLGVDQLANRAQMLLKQLASPLGEEMVNALLTPATTESALAERRGIISILRERLGVIATPEARVLAEMADYLAPKSVWLMGGDGWAYDIGYGGLDHVLSMPRKINVLVLDSEVYSNTGGQMSKATPLGASAKFATLGKNSGKKDLGLMAMCYGNAYVASIAFGENDNHTVKTLLEAESYPGPSLVIAYAHCIAHGYNLSDGINQQQRAVRSGMWPLYRFDPRLAEQGKSPLQIDSKPPSVSVADYMENQPRFRIVQRSDPARFAMLEQLAEERSRQRANLYAHLAEVLGRR